MRLSTFVFVSLLGGALTPAAVHATPRRASRSLPSHEGAAPRRDGLPAKAPRDARCPAPSASSARYLSSQSHTPLAVVTKGALGTGAVCCESVARTDATWLALDAYGRVTGEAHVVTGRRDDSTACFRLSLETTRGASGSGLYVEKIAGAEAAIGEPAAGGLVPRGQGSWTPTRADLASLAQAYDELSVARTSASSTCGDKQDDRAPLERRSLFFLERGVTSAEDEDPREFAVVGGHVLAVFRHEGRRWTLVHEDASVADRCRPRAYQPVAAFDLDHNGLSEVVVHVDSPHERLDVVLGLATVAGSSAESWVELVRGVPVPGR